MIKRIVITSLLVPVFFLPGLPKNNNEYQLTDNYNNLRNKIFTVPAEKRSDNIEDDTIYSIVMEFGCDNVVATLAARNDGTVSLFYSNDKIYKKIRKQSKLKEICLRLINEAENHIRFARKTLDETLPEKGEAAIYFITVNRQYKLKDTEYNLKNNKSELSQLYFIAQELMAEINSINRLKK
jgi:hypothetical protein